MYHVNVFFSNTEPFLKINLVNKSDFFFWYTHAYFNYFVLQRDSRSTWHSPLRSSIVRTYMHALTQDTWQNSARCHITVAVCWLAIIYHRLARRQIDCIVSRWLIDWFHTYITSFYVCLFLSRFADHRTYRWSRPQLRFIDWCNFLENILENTFFIFVQPHCFMVAKHSPGRQLPYYISHDALRWLLIEI